MPPRTAWATPANSRAAEANLIGGVSARADGAKTIILVQGSATPSFTAYRLDQPARLVIDIANGRLGLRGEERQLLADTWAVGQVQLDERAGEATQAARLIVNLKRSASYTVRPQGHDLVITVLPDESPAEGEGVKKELERLSQARVAMTNQAQELVQLQRKAEAQRVAAERAVETLRREKDAQQVEASRLVAQQREADASLRTAQQERDRTASELSRLQQVRAQLLKQEQDQEQEKAKGQLRELSASRLEAEQRIRELDGVLKARHEEVARLQSMQQARKEEEDAHRKALAGRRAAEESLLRAQQQRQQTESELARLEAARRELQQQDQSLTQRLSRTEQVKSSQLQALQREVAGAQGQATLLQGQIAAARDALERTEQLRLQAEQAQRAETARLATLQTAREQAERERQAVLARHREQLQRLTEAQHQTELARQSEEGRLRSVQRAREQAEAELRALAQEQAVQTRRLAQLRTQAAQVPAPAPAAQSRPVVAQGPAPAAQARPVVAQVPAPAAQARPVVAQAPAPAAQARPVVAQAAAPMLAARPAPARVQRLERDSEEGRVEPPASPFMRQSITLRPYALVLPQGGSTLGQIDDGDEDPTPAPRPRAIARPMAEPRAESEPRARSAAEINGAVAVQDVRIEEDGRGERVIVELGAAGVETTVYTDRRTAVLRMHGVALPRQLMRTLDASAYQGPVETVSSFPDPRERGAVRLVVSLRRPVSPTLRRQGTRLLWEFPREAVTVRTFQAQRFAFYGNPTIPMQLGGSRVPVTAGKMRRYSGRRIDLDFKDADIHNILRLLSDVGQVNIITTDEVRGTVTIRMRDVPWDQALDVVLRAKGLGAAKEGNLIRVAPQAVLDKEAEIAVQRQSNIVALAPIETRLVPLSYAQAADMKNKVADVLSPRGKVTTDERTNVLIISDMAANIALAEDLIRNLDTQTPQVLIEARIVEARATFSRGIGIQWGGNFVGSPSNGLGTGLSFPSSIGVAGGSTDAQTNRDPVTSGVQFGAANPFYLVNLPVAAGSGNGAALGIALGSLSGAVNVNLRLSAFENSGNVRLISAPKIITADNFEASIEQGVSIPVQVVSAAGANTQFIDAKLNLSVKPHVTNDGSVVMDIKISRNEPDFSNLGSRGDPSILKREAKTHMLVRDGDTAVIGGIYTRNTAVSYKKIPVLADIPILGWLFKNRTDNDDRNELLIFITPRIINRPASTPGGAQSR